MGGAVDQEVKYNSIDDFENKLELGRVLRDIIYAIETQLQEFLSAFVERVRVNLLFAKEFFVILMYHLINLVWYKLFGSIKVNKSYALPVILLYNVSVVKDLLLEIGEHMEKMEVFLTRHCGTITS
jgi:hypothetical protein